VAEEAVLVTLALVTLVTMLVTMLVTVIVTVLVAVVGAGQAVVLLVGLWRRAGRTSTREQ
jgi:hypothetical protein